MRDKPVFVPNCYTQGILRATYIASVAKEPVASIPTLPLEVSSQAEVNNEQPCFLDGFTCHQDQARNNSKHLVQHCVCTTTQVNQLNFSMQFYQLYQFSVDQTSNCLKRPTKTTCPACAFPCSVIRHRRITLSLCNHSISVPSL